MSHERKDRIAIPIQGWDAFRAERSADEHGDRVAIPIQGWAAFLAPRHWGGDSGPIEE